MRLNAKSRTTEFTHEGAPAVSFLNDEQKLRRSVMSCLLWENSFYEDGQSIADRIVDTALRCRPDFVASLAIEARSKYNLRHAPLLLLDVLTKTGAGTSLVADTISAVIQRADELAEFVAIYWRNGKHPLSAQAKKGLARAFRKFDAYQLAKYNRDNDVKLRDVMFLAKPKPKDEAQAETFRKLANNELESPDTWEVQLSGGADKRETFERLIREGKLGYLALLRNLRNMDKAGGDHDLVKDAIVARKGADRVLPFRFIAAARAVPAFEPALDQAMIEGLKGGVFFDDKTIVLVDVSGSMNDKLSARSDLTRMDAAAALGSVIVGKSVRVFSFSNNLIEVPYRLGMAGVDAVIRSQPHCGTQLGRAIECLNVGAKADRLIVITDEQSHDRVPAPNFERAYMINVASNKNGVGYGNGWTHVDGFSESVLRYIYETENDA